MMNRVFFLIYLLIFSMSCNADLTIVSYNVQNLFDDVNNKSEYGDFKTWGKKDFENKTKNIAYAINKFSKRKLPDIILFQEMENQNALNHLNEYIYMENGKRYKYKAISQNSFQFAVNNAALSNYPIIDQKTHFAGNKLILELHIKYKKTVLVIFNVHLKSGSSPEDAAKRKQSVLFLKDRIKEIKNKHFEILIVGDFNSSFKNKNDVFNESGIEDKTEFKITFDKNAVSEDNFFTYCDKDYGTYYYKRKNECLDYFLLSKDLLDNKLLYLKEVSVFKDDFLFYRRKIPYRFTRKNAKGYSDHLPIFLKLGYK